MLDKNHIEEYKSIKAPEELKDKIMSLSEEKIVPIDVRRNATIKRIVTAAACAVIIFAGSSALYNNSGRIEVSSNGEILDGAPVAVQVEENSSVMRALLLDTVRLDADITEVSVVRVSKGEFRIIAANGEASDYVAEISVSEDFSVEWQIPASVNYAEMTLENNKNMVCVAAERNVNDGLIYLTVK